MLKIPAFHYPSLPSGKLGDVGDGGRLRCLPDMVCQIRQTPPFHMRIHVPLDLPSVLSQFLLIHLFEYYYFKSKTNDS